jgi:hypothetical protein
LLFHKALKIGDYDKYENILSRINSGDHKVVVSKILEEHEILIRKYICHMSPLCQAKEINKLHHVKNNLFD